MLLRLQGHDVRVVHNGRAALAQASSFLPHMVFLDIGMPEMDGYEVATLMRQQCGLEGVVCLSSARCSLPFTLCARVRLDLQAAR
jgi:CheY-like chemotaxis protein